MVRQGATPVHVALIMDGNRRYARQRNLKRIEGHSMGFEKLKEVRAPRAADEGRRARRGAWSRQLKEKEKAVFFFRSPRSSSSSSRRRRRLPSSVVPMRGFPTPRALPPLLPPLALSPSAIAAARPVAAACRCDRGVCAFTAALLHRLLPPRTDAGVVPGP